MRIWHSLTFEQKVFAVFAGIFLLVSMNCLLIFLSQRESADDLLIISKWEKEKAGVEQILHLLLKSETDQMALEREAIRQMASFSQLLKSSFTGGVIDNTDIAIPPADEETAAKLEKVRSSWENLRNAVNIYIKEPAQKDTIYQRIEEVPISDTLNIFTTRVINDIRTIENPLNSGAKSDMEEYLPQWSIAGSSFISFLHENNQQNANQIFNISLVFWTIITVGLLILLVSIRKYYFTPLREVLSSGEKISKGYYTDTIKEQYPHEIGRISNIFNHTAETFASATQFITDLGNRKIQDTMALAEDPDENSLTGALVKMQSQMKSLEQEEQERKWISEGLTKFADLLRTNNHSLSVLTDKVTAALVKYTGSVVGGTYLLNDEEESALELSAVYAFNTKKYLTKKYRPGEGLVGQTFLEEDYIYLLEIPDNYISVVSGIGEVSPKAILLVPLKMEGAVFGVIELASLKEYRTYEIDFVRKLSESIASTIQSVKINERTQKLLEESQEMTDLMRSQEEEMRQNMEELSATQEEMARKEQETVKRLEVINNNLILAEYDVNKKITHTSKIFAHLHQFSVEDLIGRSMISLSPASHHLQLEEIFTSLLKGQAFKGQIVRKNSAGKEFTLDCSLSPVTDDKGEIIKIVEISTEIKETAYQEDISELDKMLRQNLKAMDITQETLINRAKSVIAQYEDVQDVLMTFKTDTDGILSQENKELNQLFGRQILNVKDLEGIPEDILNHDAQEGIISDKKREVKFFMKKISKDSYLFMILNI